MESSPSYKPSRVYRAYSHGELIADGVVHAAALVAGLIGFSLLFQRIALYGGPAAVAGEVAAQALRPRLDISHDRRHVHRAPLASLFRYLDGRSRRDGMDERA